MTTKTPSVSFLMHAAMAASVSLSAGQAVPSVQAAKNAWEPLPEVKYEQRTIDGKEWTEGLSKLAMGRFAVNPVNGLMNETVEDYAFYKSLYDMFSYSGYPRDYFDMHIPGTDDIPEKDELSGDWTHQIRVREYEGGRKVKLIMGSATPGFLVETNAPRFTLTKREVEKDRVDWRGTIPEHERRGVFPILLLVPREGGKVEIVTRERGEWNTPMNLGKPAQPWVVAVYPPVSRQFLWNFDAAAGKFRNKDSLWEFPNYLGDDAVAVLMTFREGLGLRTQFGELTLYSPDKKEIGTVGLSTAFDELLKNVQSGLKEVKPHPGEVLIAESMAQQWHNDKWNFTPIAQRATALAKLLHTYPLSTREWFRVEEESGEVKIRNEFTYHKWGSKEWQQKDYAPAPMAFALSHKDLGWPLFKGIADPGIRGRLGPFLYFADQNWCEWSIPLCRPEYALQPDMPEPEKEVLAGEVKAFAAKESYTSTGTITAADLEPGSENYAKVGEIDRRWGVYKVGAALWWQSFGRALTVWPMLDDEGREALLKKMRPLLRYAYSPGAYYRKKEPVSGREYANCATAVEAPGYMAGDVPTYIAGPIYFGYLYAKFSGDWKFLEPYYRQSWDASRFTEIYADWSWPGNSLREHLFVSHFDPMICGVLGFVGLERLSAIFGTPEEHERAQYLLSRTAASIVTQALLPRWVDPENQNPALTCDGASEHGPMLLDFDVVTGNIRKQRSYFAWAWLGQQPELFRYRQQVAGARYWRDFQEKFVSNKKWNWTKDLAGIVHAAMRAWIRDWPREDLIEFLSSKQNYAGQTNNLLAGSDGLTLLWARKNEVPAFLVEWEPAVVKSFSWDGKNRRLLLTVDFPKEGQIAFRSWNTLPGEALVNGAAVTPSVRKEGIPAETDPHRDEMGPLFALSLPAGPSEIVLTWKKQK